MKNIHKAIPWIFGWLRHLDRVVIFKLPVNSIFINNFSTRISHVVK